MPLVLSALTTRLFNHLLIDLCFHFQDASSAAGQAKNKLMERQEKLEVTYLQKNDPKLKFFVLITYR